jgi:hypothetical protein
MYVIISLLMFPLMRHRPSLWITQGERAKPIRRAQCVVGTNDCKCSHRLIVHSEAHGRARDNKLLVTHLMTFAKYE